MSTKTERRVESRPGRESRHRAREAALQMLYQWEVGRSSLPEVLETFWLHEGPSSGPMSGEHRAFAERLAAGVVSEVASIDPIIIEAAENWRIERMAVLDRLILRLAVWEFLKEPETPAGVVINEGLELARTFSNDDAVRFVNGVLDAIRRRLERE